MRVYAVGAKKDERHSQQKGREALWKSRGGEQAKQNAPGKERGQCGGSRGIEIVVENDTAKESYDRGLDDEGKGRIR